MNETLRVRTATLEDLPAIVSMLADDPLGARREDLRDPLPDGYRQAFAAIDRDPSQELIVVESAGAVVATMQLSFLQYLTYRGGLRMQIESVRVSRKRRGERIGAQLFQWAIDRARGRGCHLVQLTTDKARPDALRFYERLGFKATHEGLKLQLDR